MIKTVTITLFCFLVLLSTQTSWSSEVSSFVAALDSAKKFSRESQNDSALVYIHLADKLLEQNLTIEDTLKFELSYIKITILRESGLLDEALKKAHLTIASTSKSIDTNKLALLYVLIGGIYGDQMLFDSSLTQYDRALSIISSTNEYNPTRASILNNKSSIYAEMNRSSDAEKALKTALEICKINEKKNLFFIVNITMNLASVYADQKKYAESNTEYIKCISLLDSLPLNHKSLTVRAYVYENLALNMVDYQYNDSGALNLLQKSLSIMDTLPSIPVLDKAMVYQNMGFAYLNLKDYSNAESYTKRACDIYESIYGVNHPDFGSCLSTIAFVRWCQGRYSEAVTLQNQAYQTLLANFRNTFEISTEKDALKYAKILNLAASNYMTMLWDGRAVVSRSKTKLASLIFSSKGQVTEGMAARHQSLHLSTDSTLAELMTQLHEAKKELAELVNSPAEEDEHEEYVAELETAAAVKDSLEQELVKKSKSYAVTQKLRNVSAEQIAKALPMNSKLVEFIRFDYNLSSNYSIPRYMAIVLSQDGISEVIDIGSAAPVDSLVSAYLRHIKYLENDNYSEATYRQLSSALYAKLWNPFAEKLDGASLVFIAPDGPLNLIAFSGLLDDSNHFLIEKYPTQLLASGRDLIRLKNQEESNTGLLAVGDINYGHTNFTPLPGTRAEIEMIAQSWSNSRAEPLTTLLGDVPTKEKFLKEAEGKRIIHLATHGYYQPTSVDSNVIEENPFLTSGLVFAEGQKLAAEEVTSLQLNGTDLVVLTACESGLGKIEEGEGSYGVRRAFQMAGARTVVSALWAVSDSVTADLMGKLYNSHDQNIPELLRGISLDYIQNERGQNRFPHPKKWAAFIALGDWKMK